MGGTDTSAQQSQDHGARALYPWQIPLRGWLDILRRVGHETLRDHVFITSAGVAFLVLFALLPTLTALVSVYGLVTSPEQLSHQLQSLSSVAPNSVVKMLRSDLHSIVRASGLRLGFSTALSIIVAVWVAVRGVLGIMSALNIVYGEKEKRSWPVLLGTALALALGALVFWMLALFMIAGAPWVIGLISPGSTVPHVLIQAARWLIITVAALISMTVLYRFGPSHAQPHWQWWSAGSLFGTALWLAGSAGMSFYLSHGGHFSSAYGPLGMVMVVMTWFFLSAFVFLLGAEFNIEIEHQTQPAIRE